MFLIAIKSRKLELFDAFNIAQTFPAFPCNTSNDYTGIAQAALMYQVWTQFNDLVVKPSAIIEPNRAHNFLYLLSFSEGHFMKRTLAVVLLAMAAPTVAGDYTSKPVPIETDSLTYYKGVPVLERSTSFGKVRITSIGEETGKPAFVVEILNETEAPINFGTENITAKISGQAKPAVVYTANDIQKMVQNKANWAAALTAMAGASANNTSYGTACGYGSCVTASVTTPDYYARANAARQVSAIRENEAGRIDELSQNYLQLTTVQPGEGYGGRVAISKPKPKKWPALLTLTVMGEPVAFEISK